MMAWTDAWYRVMLRAIDPDIELWSEMLPANALWRHPDKARMVTPDHSTVVQLGGQNPIDLAKATNAIEGKNTHTYKEVNLNMGCPSPRVKRGGFGAQMMLDPVNAAACLRAMAQETDLPLSVKIRIGVDAHDSFAWLCDAVAPLIEAGCVRVIVHARKALLNGISPRANRKVPPLNLARAYELRTWLQARYAVRIDVNGGFDTETAIVSALSQADGVMLGRAVTRNPMLLWSLRAGATTTADRQQAILNVLTRFADILRTHESGWRHADVGGKPFGTVALMRSIQRLGSLFHGHACARTARADFAALGATLADHPGAIAPALQGRIAQWQDRLLADEADAADSPPPLLA